MKRAGAAREHVAIAYEFPLVASREASLRIEMKSPERAPANWAKQWDGIARARASTLAAPVDTMGCERLFDPAASAAERRFQHLVSFILSAQSKDEKTKQSVDNLLQAGLATPEKLAALQSADELEVLIRPSGLYRAKAKALIGTSRMLLEKHAGDVPSTLKELLELPGVGPKIANLALSVCWGKDEGIGCDVHVTRITQRLGWAKKGGDAEQTRKELEEWLPRSLWRPINFMLVGFGQTVCAARPKCDECPIADICPSVEKRKKLKTEELVETSATAAATTTYTVSMSTAASKKKRETKKPKEEKD